MFSIHIASISKRFGAGMFDLIVLIIIATGLVFVCNSVLGYDRLFAQYENDIERIEKEYGISLDITGSEYENLSEQQMRRYDEAYDALINETSITENYQKLIRTIVLSITIALFLAYTVTDVVLPIVFKEGRTLGKKLFGVCLISYNQVRVSNYQVVCRALLGKFAVETMVLAYSAVLLMFNRFGIVQLVLIAALFIAQVVFFFFGGNRKLLHDVLAQTVVADYATQKIFESYDSLLEAKKEQAALEAERAEY